MTPTPRPHIRCHHTPPEGTTPEPGTLLRQPDNTTVLYAGAEWPTPVLDVTQLAEQLADTRQVTLLGPAARQLKAALHQHWNQQQKAARDAAKPPPKVKPAKQLCGQPTKYGTPCGQSAGWGTDTPGQGPCWYHGGSDALKQEEFGLVRQHADTFARLHRKSQQAPLTIREQLDSVQALRAVLAWQQRPKRRRRR